MTRLRIPEVFVGALLTVAVFAMGLTVASQTTSGSFWGWLTHDASGFFTSLLFIVGGAQLWLFLRQLTFIRESLVDAKKSGDAATASAIAAKEAADAARLNAQSVIHAERAYIFGGPGLKLNANTIGLTVGNYGKTLGVLKKISVGFCPLREWSEDRKDAFSEVFPLEDGFFPGNPPRNMNIKIQLGGEEDLVLYGRIDYADVFGKPHHSRWRHRRS
jgi:hypothetical protein